MAMFHSYVTNYERLPLITKSLVFAGKILGTSEETKFTFSLSDVTLLKIERWT